MMLYIFRYNIVSYLLGCERINYSQKMGIFGHSMVHAEVLSFLLVVDRPLMKSMEMWLQLWFRIGNGCRRLVRYYLWCLFLVYFTFGYKLLDIFLCSFPIKHPKYSIACYDLWTELSVLWLTVKFWRLVVSLHAWHERNLPFFSNNSVKGFTIFP